jgi:hypothetical protein
MFYDLEAPVEFGRRIESILADDRIWYFGQSSISYKYLRHRRVEGAYRRASEAGLALGLARRQAPYNFFRTDVEFSTGMPLLSGKE